MPDVGSVPGWDSSGLLPPVRPQEPGHSPERSPYRVSLAGFVERFASSPRRTDILSGLLRFRADLHALGIASGFQWLDGSFLERIEVLEHRDPNDLDVVTFFQLPQGENQGSLSQRGGALFDHQYVKAHYSIDGYFAVLGQPVDAGQVQRITYWYSVWSHRRDGRWKGYVQVDLSPYEDADARVALDISGDQERA